MWRILAALYSFSLLFGGGDIVCANLAKLTSAGVPFPRLLYAVPLFLAGACFCILTIGVARKKEGSFWGFVRRNRLVERIVAVIVISVALQMGFDHYCKSKVATSVARVKP
jgi:predicted tellurium resistance membrane protein TerC